MPRSSKSIKTIYISCLFPVLIALTTLKWFRSWSIDNIFLIVFLIKLVLCSNLIALFNIYNYIMFHVLAMIIVIIIVIGTKNIVIILIVFLY